MDIWGSIYIGKRWVEDDGSTKVEIQNTKEWHVKTAHKVKIERTEGFSDQYVSLSMEVGRAIAEQLKQMRDELLHFVEHGIDPEEAEDERKNKKQKRNADAAGAGRGAKDSKN